MNYLTRSFSQVFGFNTIPSEITSELKPAIAIVPLPVWSPGLSPCGETPLQVHFTLPSHFLELVKGKSMGNPLQSLLGCNSVLDLLILGSHIRGVWCLTFPLFLNSSPWRWFQMLLGYLQYPLVIYINPSDGKSSFCRWLSRIFPSMKMSSILCPDQKNGLWSGHGARHWNHTLSVIATWSLLQLLLSLKIICRWIGLRPMPQEITKS